MTAGMSWRGYFGSKSEREQAARILIQAQEAMNREPIPETTQFTRFSIPLVRRIYPLFATYELRAGGHYRNYNRKEKEKVNWAKDGF